MSLSAMPLILRCTKTDHDRSSHDISALSGSPTDTVIQISGMMPRPAYLRRSSRSGRVPAIRRSCACGGCCRNLGTSDHNRAGLGPGGEMVPRQHLVLQGGEERLRGGIVETRPDPAHRLAHSETLAQAGEMPCGVG